MPITSRTLKCVVLVAAFTAIGSPKSSAEVFRVPGEEVANKLNGVFENSIIALKGVRQGIGSYSRNELSRASDDPPHGKIPGSCINEDGERSPDAYRYSEIVFQKPLRRKVKPLRLGEIREWDVRERAGSAQPLAIKRYFITFGISCWDTPSVRSASDHFKLTFQPSDATSSVQYWMRPIFVRCSEIDVSTSLLNLCSNRYVDVTWRNPRIEVRLEPVVHKGAIGFQATQVSLLGPVGHPFNEMECERSNVCQAIAQRFQAEAADLAQDNLGSSIRDAINGGERVPIGTAGSRRTDTDVQDSLALIMVGSLRELGVRRTSDVKSVRMDAGELVIESE